MSLAPLLIGSFAFNFNNSVLIYLLTNGGLAVLDAAVPVGSTDILITFTDDLAAVPVEATSSARLPPSPRSSSSSRR